MRLRIRDLFADPAKYQGKEVNVMGWVRTNRAQAQFGFLNVNDGSYFDNLQVVYDDKLSSFTFDCNYPTSRCFKNCIEL